MHKRDMKKTTSKIVNFIKDTFKEKGFTKAIIGISGGLDSAVVAKLLVLALGNENVWGILLPCKHQSDLDDAKLVASKLDIHYETINIISAVDSLKDMVSYEDDGSMGELMGEANIKARVRMIVLYDLSAFHDALVVGTGNRTELELGYFTLYGDGACALEPIGHLYKTEVFELARYLKVPEVIINKAPSAGLWEGQTDKEELGYSYEEIDNCLDFIYNDNHSSYIPDAKIIIKLSEMIKKNKFKSELPKMIKE